jgi:uncharacterized membrane protein HdeD (DUF308 family)
VVARTLYAFGAVIGLFSVTLGIIAIIAARLNHAIAPRWPALWRL